MKTTPRVLIIGIDSASFRITSKLIRQGSLPLFARLKNRGCFGRLHSTVPPVSPVAWPSLVTGLNPWKHGIFDFVYRDSEGNLRPYSSSKIAGLAMWDILGQKGYRVAVLNVPMTYPAYPVNGLMVSGPPVKSNVPDVYCKEYDHKYDKLLDRYTADIPGIDFSGYSGLDKTTFLDLAIKVTKKKFDLAVEVVRHGNYDFVMFVTTELDRIHHAFGRSLFDMTYPASDEDKRLVTTYYSSLEQQLSRLLDVVDDDVTILIASDHGFEPLIGRFGINNFLLERGLLRLDIRSRIAHSFQSLVPQWLIQRTMRIFSKALTSRTRTSNHKGILEISHESLAASYNLGCITVNRNVGVSREKLIEEIVDLIRDKQGIRLIEEVRLIPKSCGKEMNCPDAVVIPMPGYEPLTWSFPAVQRRLPFSRRRITQTATHHSKLAMDGLFIAIGKGVKQGVEVDCSLLDIAPTIYHIFGLPVPLDLDGTILSSIFEGNLGELKQQARGPPITGRLRLTQEGISPDEERDILERLSRLGYI